jgi:hypothetical protein
MSARHAPGALQRERPVMYCYRAAAAPPRDDGDGVGDGDGDGLGDGCPRISLDGGAVVFGDKTPPTITPIGEPVTILPTAPPIAAPAATRAAVVAVSLAIRSPSDIPLFSPAMTTQAKSAGKNTSFARFI